MLEAINAFVQKRHMVASGDPVIVLREDNDDVKMQVRVLAAPDTALGLKIENCHPTMVRVIPREHPLGRFQKTLACCDYLLMVRHDSSWHMLFVELVKSFSSALHPNRQKLEQLVSTKPLADYLLSVTDLLHESHMPSISFEYFIFFETLGLELPYSLNALDNKVHGHPREILVHKSPGDNEAGFLRYGSTSKHVHVLARKVTYDDQLPAPGLMADYGEFMNDFS